MFSVITANILYSMSYTANETSHSWVILLLLVHLKYVHNSRVKVKVEAMVLEEARRMTR